MMIVDKMPFGARQYTKRFIPIRAISIPMLFAVHTKEGTMTGLPGDYLIEGVEGELYPCKKGIFEKTYQVQSEPFEEVTKSELSPIIKVWISKVATRKQLVQFALAVLSGEEPVQAFERMRKMKGGDDGTEKPGG